MKLNKPTRTVVELAPEQEERVTFNATPRVEAPVVAEPEAIPPLVQTRGPEPVPPLEPVRRTMKRVELLPVQPATETGVAAESADADTDLSEEEQEYIEQELVSEQTGHLPPLVRTSKRQVVQLGQSGVESSGSSNVSEQYAGDDIRDESDRAEVDNTDQAVEEAERIPPLEPVVRNREEVPPLQLIRDGSRIEGEIPQLTSYNKMEVAHLLIGKAPDDDEVYLLSSFSARTLAGKNPDELREMLYRKVSGHVSRLVQSRFEDFTERARCREVTVLSVNEAQKARGTEWAAAYVDDGRPSSEDRTAIINEMTDSAIDSEVELSNEAIEEFAKEKGFTYENSYVFTWALVKVKIGHDFGDFKLSSLMPAL